MDISLNRIILSCFTGAEWRVKWRIVEDVLVGRARLREPTDGIADVPPWGREEKHEEKRRGGRRAAAEQQQHHRWRDEVVGRRRGRQLTGEWSRASRSSLVRPAFPRLASPSMSFFRGTTPLLAAAVRYVPPLAAITVRMYTYTWRLRRDSMHRLTRPRVALCASGFISVKNIYWFRKKKNTTAQQWRIRRFHRVFFSIYPLPDCHDCHERATRYTCVILKI